MSTSSSNPPVGVRKHFTSSILLWMRTDQPRQTGMDHWKGPHSGIIAATPGLEEYRQIHLAEANPGLWPATAGIETQIPADRKVDGVAEVTFQSALSPLRGRAQTRLAFKDEINVFRRTLLYAGAPGTSRWYEVAGRKRPSGPEPSSTCAAGTVSVAASSEGSSRKDLVPALIGTGVLKELRTQTFLPWNKKTWDTPDVAHDNPADQRFHASLILGFADAAARTAFFEGTDIEQLSQTLAPVASAIHAYDVYAALTYVKDGQILPHYQE